MELKGEELIPLHPTLVWDGLNDPEVLKASIPGCETLEASEDGWRIGMLAAVGPVKARFSGKLALADVRPPQSYTLVFEGSGGAAGYGKGEARVSLDEAEGGTRLVYVATAQVGGKIAQVGSRLIDGVAARMAGEFFTRFKDRMVPPPAVALADEPEAQEERSRWKFWS